MGYIFKDDLDSEMAIPQGAITSKPLVADASTRVILFGFDEGQELSEHTASMPAIIHILSGVAAIKLGEDSMEVSAGAWAYMDANLPHSIVAKTPVKMLLTMLKSAQSSSRSDA